MSLERKEKDSQRQGEAPAVYQECTRLLKQHNSFKEAPMEELHEYVKDIGKDLVDKKVRMNQLRKVLDSLWRIKSGLKSKGSTKLREEVQSLKIYLAYMAGRAERKKTEQGERVSVLQPFYEVLCLAIDKVIDAEDFIKFSQFIDGLVAYHKFYGGED